MPVVSLISCASCVTHTPSSPKTPKEGAVSRDYSIALKSELTASEKGTALGMDVGGRYTIPFANGGQSAIAGRVISESSLSGIRDEAGSEPKTAVPNVRSWNLSVQPVSGLTFLAGSVSVSGLASRVFKPVPAKPNAFQLPQADAYAPIANRSETRNAQRAAVECRAERLRTMILVDAEATVVMTASAFYGKASDKALNTSVVVASGHADRETGDSWFSERAPLPYRKTAISGVELRGLSGPVRFNGTLMAYLDGLRPPAHYGSIEAGIDLPWGGGASGALWMDRDFAALDGSLPGTVGRFYATPYISLVPLFPSFDGFRLGGAVYLTRERRERAWETETLHMERRGALDISRNGFETVLEARQDDAEQSIEGRFRLPLHTQRKVLAGASFKGSSTVSSRNIETYEAAVSIGGTIWRFLSVTLGGKYSVRATTTTAEKETALITASFSLQISPSGTLSGALTRSFSPTESNSSAEASLGLTISIK